MKKITVDDLEDLAVGCSMLGSGGGGDVQYDFPHALREMEKSGPVTLISRSELKKSDLIAPIGFSGAPMVQTEMIPNGQEFVHLIEMIEKTLKKKITVIMPFEIGGGNGVYPFAIAAKLKLPVLDADMMGRAFPGLHMCSYHLAGLKCDSGYFADGLGNVAKVDFLNYPSLEKIGRQAIVGMGSASALSYSLLNPAEAKKCVLNKSVSKAMNIGRVFREAKAKNEDPVQAILSICKGRVLGKGTIVDIDRAISGGFLYGSLTMKDKYETIEVFFQNEFLSAKRNGKIVATTPDILTLIEQDTGKAIMSESVRFGLKIILVTMPAPSVWTTPEGLALVGPRCFGYEMDYKPPEALEYK
jgi:uncharacterized protein